MTDKLSDALVKRLTAPERGNKITYDAETKGFGIRVTASGSRAFVLNYRRKYDGLERRYTIGSFPDWSVSVAREEAKRLKREIDGGGDPVGEHQTNRAAPTVADMCSRFLDEYVPTKRPSTQRDYRQQITADILPVIGRLKVASVSFSDIDALHRSISKRAPYHANRVLALLSKMFNLAIRWRWRADNPVRGVERNQEPKRSRYLSTDELLRLTAALAEHKDQQAANIIRLLLLTGARRGEVQSATWAQFDLEAGVWVKPGATTKQKTEHRVPLSAPARQLLLDILAITDVHAAIPGSQYVFPGRGDHHRVGIETAWAGLCKAAGITGARMHDLRHTYASVLASSGLSLPIIGALLGHTQPATTHRYAHLFDDPLRAATERAGAIITGKQSGEVVPLKGGRA